jgi:hypothetical protein
VVPHKLLHITFEVQNGICCFYEIIKAVRDERRLEWVEFGFLYKETRDEFGKVRSVLMEG